MFLFTKADGVMGLGLRYGDYNPFIYQLLKNGNISRALFSIYMNRLATRNAFTCIITSFFQRQAKLSRW